MTTETTVATGTAATADAGAMPAAPEHQPEARAVPAVQRHQSCEYWDLATCTWVRCPDT